MFGESEKKKYFCLHCGTVFESEKDAPYCPNCRRKRVVPLELLRRSLQKYGDELMKSGASQESPEEEAEQVVGKSTSSAEELLVEGGKTVIIRIVVR